MATLGRCPSRGCDGVFAVDEPRSPRLVLAHSCPRRNANDQKQAAVSRRRGRQPVAHRAAEGSARETGKGRDQRGSAQGGRRPRDREDHQEAGGGRAQSRDRRRVPPLVVAFRFFRHARRRGNLRGGSRPSSSRAYRPSTAGTASKASSVFPTIRCWSTSSSSRRTPASCRKCAYRARRRCISAWSRTPSSPRNMPTATPSSTIWRKPIGRRSAPSTMPAAAICSSTIPPGPICARRRS